MSTSQPSAPAYSDTQRREAADWFVLIRAENDPQAESIQAWLKWMDQHEGNRAAFDAVARAWHAAAAISMPAMPTRADLLADDYDAEESVEAWLARRSADNEPVAEVAATRRKSAGSARRIWLAAASVTIVFLGLLTMSRYPFWRGSRSDEFTTNIGEQMEITLSDGSHVWLGPKSELLVKFDTARRGIQLTTGEAFFAVKKDHSRPFAVRSSGGDIIAVGTAFNVRSIDRHVTVTVSEGAVSVMPTAQSTARTLTSVRVSSGQQLSFTVGQAIDVSAMVKSVAPGERARWRDGVLVYRDEPLQEVVADIVRYSNLQIEIADASIGDLHYSGVVYHDAVREWITALPESFPVTVVSDGTREIIKAR